MNFKSQPLLRGTFLYHFTCIGYNEGRIISGINDIKLSALYFLKIKDIVDYIHKRGSGGFDVFGIFRNCGLLTFTQDELIHPKDRIYGTADLMGHPCQKVALSLIGRIGEGLFDP